MEIAFAEVLFLLNSACLLEPTACVHAAHPTHYLLSRALLLLPSATTHVHVLAVKPKVWDHYILELEPCTARFVGITPADWRGALDSGFLDALCETGKPIHVHWTRLRSRAAVVRLPPGSEQGQGSSSRERPKRTRGGSSGMMGVFSGVYTDEDGLLQQRAPPPLRLK